MPQPITSIQLQILQDEIKVGGVDAAVQTYTFLEEQGYAYGGWARGVAAGDSISGQSALSYLQGTALMGMGGEACRNLSQQQIDKIRTEMAIQTLEKYKEIADDAHGVLDRDLEYLETKDIHERVFTKNQLSLENWTLNSPMELIRTKYGEQAVEDFWKQLRDTGGDGADAAVMNSMLLTFMAGAQFSGNASVRQAANAWMDRFSDISEWSSIITNAWSRNVGQTYRSIKDAWDRAKVWVLPRDPILLDLDGDGLETVGLAASIYFDHDADGVLTKTGWVGKDDALLVWDRNANGRIDTGAELFGDFTPLPNGTLAPNGFAALAALDANGDGILDDRDPAFAELKLWRDNSQDGQSGSGELISLAEAGIVSVTLTNTLKNQRLANGNTLAREGSFQRADGSTGGMGEFKLASDTYATRFVQAIEVPESLKSLPTLAGSGKVRELQQAAAQSTEMANTLAQFQQATTRTEQRVLLDQLLARWADTSGMAQSLEERAAGKYRIVYEAFGNERRSANIDAVVLAAASSGGTAGAGSLMTDYGGMHLTEHYRQLMTEWRLKMHVLEAFNGQYFFNLPSQNSQTTGANWGLAIRPGSSVGSGAGSSGGTSGGTGSAAVAIDALPTLVVNFSQPQLDLLQQSYDSLRESVYGSLVLQTRLKPYLDEIELHIDDKGVRIDVSAIDRKLAEKKLADPENYLADLLELDKYASGVLADTHWHGLTDLDSFIESLPQTAGITALLKEFNVRVFSADNQHISLADKADIALAGVGDDTIDGSNGNDRLFGQGGNDALYGGDGDDLLSGGAGDDVLRGQSGADIYVFGRGCGHDLIRDSDEQGLKRDTVRFLGLSPADVRVTLDDTDNLLFTLIDSGETLCVPLKGEGWGANGVGRYVFDDGTVWSHDDVLRATVVAGTETGDTIQGSSAGELIAGLTGDDTLIGNAGDDITEGGKGNDVLVGSSYRREVYKDGNYRFESSTAPIISANGNDTYVFGHGDGQDTIIDGDNTKGNIDTLRFGKGISPSDLKFTRRNDDLVLAIRGSSDQVTISWYFKEIPYRFVGVSRDYLIERVAFADGTVLSAADVQAALFAGNEDAETMNGSDADDVLTGQGGDDVLFGGAGHDVLDGGAGDDQLYGGSAYGNPYTSYINDVEHGEGDVYRFGRGDGHDLIVDRSWQQGETDRIEMKAGVRPGDVRVERTDRTGYRGLPGDDLRLTLRDAGATLVVSRHFGDDGRYAIEEIAFADGTLWTAETIKSRSLLGGSGNDALRGFSQRNDLIEASDGNDQIIALSGDDTLTGGAGDDVLDGGEGSDTYRFGLGDGQDVINEEAVAGQDVVQLGEGIAPADVTARFTSQGGLAVGLPDGSRLIVRDQLDKESSLRGIEQLRFFDGTTWGPAELAALALKTTAGDDDIVSGGKDDSFDGGAGNDRFDDRGGYDTYRFGKGDGKDVVQDVYGRIQFKEGIGQNEVKFAREGADLIAALPTGDALRIQDWLSGWQRIDRFEFANGASLSSYQVEASLNVDSRSEILYGSPGTDILNGSEKNGELYGGAGDDVLRGGAGSDRLFGHAGNDVLDGGEGNDALYGGEGNNTYIVATGMGLDRVFLERGERASDTVVFGPGIPPDQVSVQLSWDPNKNFFGYDEIVLGIGGNDAMRLSFYDSGRLERSALRKFRFDDGTEWTLADAIARADGGIAGYQTIYSGDPTTIIGSEADDSIRAWTSESLTVKARANDDTIKLDSGHDRISAGMGDDEIAARTGDDVIAAEAGDDNINAGTGDDVIVFNYGDGTDKLRAGDGTDTLSFGETIKPDMLSAATDRSGQVILLVDAGKGGMITLDGTRSDSLPGNLERIQFIGANGRAQIFDFAGWLRTNAASLLSATVQKPLTFDGTGCELTGTVAPAGGIEAVAYAQHGDLFAQADLSNSTTNSHDDLLYGSASGDTLLAGVGDDVMLGVDGDDALFGGSGNDLLHGGWGADRLVGSVGDDRLFGGWGGDTYVVHRGDGRDVIDDEHRILDWTFKPTWLYRYAWFDDNGKARVEGSYGEAIYEVRVTPSTDTLGFFDPQIDDAPNILEFGPGIRPEELRYSEQNGDLLIEFGQQSGDQVLLRGYDASRKTLTRSVDIIRFTDGTEIAAGPVEPVGQTVLGTEPGKWVLGGRFADTLIGGDGDDQFAGNGGADNMMGGAGSDTYRIQKVQGSRAVETVIVETWREQDRNRIEITGPVEAADLRLQFDGRDLLLSLTPQGDVIRFVGVDPRVPDMRAPVSEISLLDKNVRLSFDELLAQGLRQIAAPEDALVPGTALADRIEGGQADAVLSGGSGGDLYVIHAGDGGNTLNTLIDKEDADTSNTLVLPEGTRWEDVRLSYESPGFLIIDLARTGNRIRLSEFDPQDPLGSRAVERFRLGLNGEEISYEALLARGFDIVGTADGDALRGTALTDRLYGEGGDDLIEAAQGGDWLAGGDGNDSYVVTLGDGIVTIDDSAAADAGNVLRFGPGIDPDSLRNNLRFEDDGQGAQVLLLAYGDQGDVVRLTGFRPDDVPGSHAIERFEFADGTVVDYATLVSWTFVIEGDNADNALAGTSVGDRLYGYDGDDVLASGAGEDVLTGGLGNDVLRGGAGRDAYVLNPGDGEDIIEDVAEEGVGNSIKFGTAVSREDLRLEMSGSDLLVHYGAQGDVVRVIGQGSQGSQGAQGSGGAVIDTFEFADGTSVTLRELSNRAPQVNEVSAQISDQRVNEDAHFSLRLPEGLFIDPDGDEVLMQVSVSGSPQPNWLQYDAASRTLHGSPGNSDVGEVDVFLQAMDSLGASGLQSFHVSVQNTNDAPQADTRFANVHAQAGSAISFKLPVDGFRDVDAGDALSYSVTLDNGQQLPDWLSFDAATMSFNGVAQTAGDFGLRVMATDRSGESASQTFRLVVERDAPPQAPVVAPDMACVIEDRKQLACGNVLANDLDPEGHGLSVADPGIRQGQYGSLGLRADGAYVYRLADGSARVQSLGAGQVVTETFAYEAINGAQRTQSTLTVAVTGTNDAPELLHALADMQLARGKAFTWRVPQDSFRDIDCGDSLSYTATLSDGKPLPRWLKFDSVMQTFSGIAPANAKDSIAVRITASDARGESSKATDVFQVRFVKGKSGKASEGRGNEGRGIEGLGNDLDQPPPGHAINLNDGSGTSPGYPGLGREAIDKGDLLSRFLEAYAGDAHSQSGLIPLDDSWPLRRRDLPQLDVSGQAPAFWNDGSRGADPFAWSSFISGTSHCPVNGIEPKGITSSAALPVPRSGAHNLF